MAITNLTIIGFLATNWVTVTIQSPPRSAAPGGYFTMEMRYDTHHQIGTVVSNTVTRFQFEDQWFELLLKTVKVNPQPNPAPSRTTTVAPPSIFNPDPVYVPLPHEIYPNAVRPSSPRFDVKGSSGVTITTNDVGFIIGTIQTTNSITSDKIVDMPISSPDDLSVDVNPQYLQRIAANGYLCKAIGHKWDLQKYTVNETRYRKCLICDKLESSTPGEWK